MIMEIPGMIQHWSSMPREQDGRWSRIPVWRSRRMGTCTCSGRDIHCPMEKDPWDCIMPVLWMEVLPGQILSWLYKARWCGVRSWVQATQPSSVSGNKAEAAAQHSGTKNLRMEGKPGSALCRYRCLGRSLEIPAF